MSYRKKMCAKFVHSSANLCANIFVNLKSSVCNFVPCKPVFFDVMNNTVGKGKIRVNHLPRYFSRMVRSEARWAKNKNLQRSLAFLTGVRFCFIFFGLSASPVRTHSSTSKVSFTLPAKEFYLLENNTNNNDRFGMYNFLVRPNSVGIQKFLCVPPDQYGGLKAFLANSPKYKVSSSLKTIQVSTAFAHPLGEFTRQDCCPNTWKVLAVLFMSCTHCHVLLNSPPI